MMKDDWKSLNETLNSFQTEKITMDRVFYYYMMYNRARNNDIDTIVPEQMVSVQNEPITPVVINAYERVTPVQVNSDSNVLPPTNNDLNTMMKESQNNQSINEDVNSKQYVKTNDDKQRGFVSISNVILVVLCITTFILMAMILNLLLK